MKIGPVTYLLAVIGAAYLVMEIVRFILKVSQ